LLSSHRHTWEENIKIDLEEIRYEDLVSIQRSHNKVLWWDLADMVINLRVLEKVGKSIA
jgi:hypothetical protein